MDLDSNLQCKPSGIYFPTYALFLVLFFYFLLFIIITVLAYLLYRSRVNGYKIMETPILPETMTQRNYSPQVSQETPSINLDVLHKKKTEENYTLHALDENKPQDKPINQTNKANIANRQLLITKELGQHRILKKNGTHSIMLKDDINKICQNELSKSQANGNNTSLKDLHNMIKEDSHRTPADFYEKSASTAQLDEYYDELPERRPVKPENFDEADAMYDCPTSAKSVICRDSQTDYLFPMSRPCVSIGLTSEPLYINAGYK